VVKAVQARAPLIGHALADPGSNPNPGAPVDLPMLLVPRPEVRAVREPEATLLLDGVTGTYLKLNATASLVWDALAAGKGRTEILADLQTRFPDAASRLGVDLDRLLAELCRRRLVVALQHDTAPASALRSAVAARVARELIRTEQREPPSTPEVAGPAAVGSASPRLPTRTEAPYPARAAQILGLPRAFATLLLTDLVLRALGYPRFRRLITGWRVSRRAPPPGDAQAVCAQVDTAARYYFKCAWCLQRSAATVCLLRLGGWRAHLVLGVHELPFMAHAWVELDGTVINDDPRVRRFYREIDRL
jgi:Transglutaminase-like superfamily/Coenzyme PQQ synthesis protein D (PqqD)